MDRNEFLEALPLTRITLKLTTAALEMCTDDIDDIHIMVSGADTDVKALRISVSGNQLLVEQPAVNLQKSPVSNGWMQVTIRLPQSWKGRIDARTVSGWITTRGLNGSDLTMDSVSGLISANTLLVSDATIRTVTGDVRVTGLVCTKATLGSTSGSISITASRMYHAALTTITGGMTLSLDAPFLSISANSVIGDLAIDAPISACRTVYRSVAGRISTHGISLPESADASVQFSTVSGNLDITNPEVTP